MKVLIQRVTHAKVEVDGKPVGMIGVGVLVFVGIWLLTFTPHLGWIFLTCLNALLSSNFILRLIKTRKFVPSGMLLAITVAVLIFCLIHLKNA